MTGREKLNEWLEYVGNELELPTHRREIGPSGNNFEWLCKAVRKGHIAAPDEIKAILAQGIEGLLK